MTRRSISAERRTTKRFQVKDEASFILTPNCTELGEIVDISKTGLAFCYVGEGEWSTESKEKAILFSDKDCFLDDIPLEFVSDQAIDDPSASNHVVIRRRGVKFGELTPEQNFQLEYFIWVNAVKEA